MIAQKSQHRKCKKLETLHEQPEITNKLVTQTEDNDCQAHMVTLSLIKEARIYSGEKTASSISGAGKTGQQIGRVHV